MSIRKTRGADHGVTLIELLITMVIGLIAFLALAPSFIAERRFWIAGNAQAESQRDAQMALRAVARQARQSLPFFGPTPLSPYQIVSAGPTGAIIFAPPSGGTVCFAAGPAKGNQLIMMTGGCGVGPANQTILIDGVRSKVVEFSLAEIVPRKLVYVKIQVSHQPILTSTRIRNEVLETELFLRIGT